MNINRLAQLHFGPALDTDLAAAARLAAGHIVVAAVYEQLALGAYLIPNRVDDQEASPPWIARIWWVHDDSPMPEVGIAGLAATLLHKNPKTSSCMVCEEAFAINNGRELTTTLLPYEIQLIGGEDEVLQVFEPSGACETALEILREYEDFVEWAVDELTQWYDLEPWEVHQYVEGRIPALLDESGPLPCVL